MAASCEVSRPAFCLATGADLDLYARPEIAERYARNEDSRPRNHDWIAYTRAVRRWDEDAWLELARRVPTPLYRTFRKAVFSRFARMLGSGLARAVGINYFPAGTVPVGDEILRRCAPETPRVFLPMSEASAIVPQPPPDNSVLRLFNATRFDWQPPFPPMVGEWENKRNDVLVRGIALFYRKTGQPIDVRFVEKGHSVQVTRELLETLGIAHLVTWRTEMTQQDVFREYAAADVVSEQFGRHAVGMAGYDAMASERPVICNWRPAVFAPHFGETVPVAQAETPAEVANQLERLHRPAWRRELGVQGRLFVERHLDPARAARTVLNLFERRLARRTVEAA
jgi:glycosyltransferase involved in cell wall biosynthesis